MRNHLHIIRWVNISLFLFGTIVFGALLAYIQLDSQDFERRSQALIAHEIEKELGERLSSPLVSRLKDLTAKVSDRVADGIEQVQAEISAGVPQFVGAVIAAMCRLDCENRAGLEAAVLKVYEDWLARLKLQLHTLRAMVEDKYKATLAELRHDIAIFVTSNLIAMTLGLALALFRGKAARHLLPIASLLGISTLFMSYWYIFEQNWALAIIYSDYFGWSYLIFLGLIFLLLMDIALNRARITILVFNWVLNAVGAAIAALAPC